MLRNEGSTGSATQGLVAAGRLLKLGVKSGATGLVSKPRKGLEADGVAGLVRGVGVGVLGAVVKPWVGVLDAVASCTCCGGLARAG